MYVLVDEKQVPRRRMIHIQVNRRLDLIVAKRVLERYRKHADSQRDRARVSGHCMRLRRQL